MTDTISTPYDNTSQIIIAEIESINEGLDLIEARLNLIESYTTPT